MRLTLFFVTELVAASCWYFAKRISFPRGLDMRTVRHCTVLEIQRRNIIRFSSITQFVQWSKAVGCTQKGRVKVWTPCSARPSALCHTLMARCTQKPSHRDNVNTPSLWRSPEAGSSSLRGSDEQFGEFKLFKLSKNVLVIWRHMEKGEQPHDSFIFVIWV